MSTSPLFLDFEFTNVSEPTLRLVSCATFDQAKNEKLKWWLDKDAVEQKKLKEYISRFNLLIAYSAIAEARCLINLKLDPLKYRWVDLYLEYRCLTNHNDKLQWGKQLVDGKVKMTFKPKPKWELENGETNESYKQTHSLAEATYKLLGQIRDTEHKKKMRDLIISGPEKFSQEEKEAILNYGIDDVEHLPELYSKMLDAYKELIPDIGYTDLRQEMELRGRYAAHTAIMEQGGYPINLEKTKNFSMQVGNILFDCQREINELFPEIKPFKWNKKDQKFTWDQNKTRDWIRETQDTKRWELTETGNISLSLEAWTKFFDFKHDYPKDNFGAQIVRYLKLKQSLYGFVPTKDSSRKTFWDYVGKDGRARPYTNIYGAQSSRSQPSSTGFMFLKPAWMRALVEPSPGKAMAGIDYGSQEFFISALLSGDRNMIDAYLSGDVYLGFYKFAGVVPEDATKETHKKERDAAKSTVLGISYLMTKYGLAIKLSGDTGQKWTEEEAQEQIDLFYQAFPTLQPFQQGVIQEYYNRGYLKLPCGWVMFGDNPNERSIANCPIQGFGASVMRKAVDLAVAAGLEISFTLHDAIYIEFNLGEEWKIQILEECMREAFVFYFPEELKEFAKKIKLEPFAWSPEYKENSEINLEFGDPIPCSNLYIDERAKIEYDKFSKYFIQDETQQL